MQINDFTDNDGSIFAISNSGASFSSLVTTVLDELESLSDSYDASPSKLVILKVKI